MNRIIIGLLLISLVYSCNKKQENFEITNVLATSNIGSVDNNKTLEMDYNQAYENGFVIPSITQTNNGFFEFKFDVKNNTNKDKTYFYKIYYQNESYKFSEEHPYSNENFYGSWEDTEITFKQTDIVPSDGNFHTIKTDFRIVGNPRNEKIYYGSNLVGPITQEEIEAVVSAIRNTPEWYASVVEKAKNNELDINTQLHMDGIFVAKSKRNEGDHNNRWKRNPRVGDYKFLLVMVEDTSALNTIPTHIQNISLKNTDDTYVNPFKYFKELNTENITAIYAEDNLKIVLKPKIKEGIYVNTTRFTNPNLDTTYYSESCNSSNNLLHNACFEQFVSTYVAEFKFNNIPVVADVHGGEYLKSDYYSSLNKKYDFIKKPIEVSECPCKTLGITNNKIVLKNPATKVGEWRKENVGVISRHGLSYGKYRVKAKLPPLLNKDNLWNGLTNAIWLIYQQGDWNKRRTCNANGGYIPRSYPGTGEISYVPNDIYSEIDIEIVKGSRNWPLSSYGGDASKKPKDPITDSNKVMVSYTNWDLACQDPENFNRGVFDLKRGNTSYSLHRWDSWYQAITGKYGELNDVLFNGPYYWFEIEWKPDEIIWRIGAEKNKMIDIGYVNSTVSSIPNNQMLLVVTQEWHLENWWPEAPFNQNFIPFPSKEITGEILEIEIE